MKDEKPIPLVLVLLCVLAIAIFFLRGAFS